MRCNVCGRMLRVKNKTNMCSACNRRNKTKAKKQEMQYKKTREMALKELSR